MVQARALLVAIALTVTVSPALAVPVPTCEQVREQAQNLSAKRICSIARRAGLTAQRWQSVTQCLGDKAIKDCIK